MRPKIDFKWEVMTSIKVSDTPPCTRLNTEKLRGSNRCMMDGDSEKAEHMFDSVKQSQL